MEAAPSTPLLPPFAADPEAGPFVSRRWMLSLYANIFFSSSYNARSFSNRAYHVGPTRVSMRTHPRRIAHDLPSTWTPPH